MAEPHPLTIPILEQAGFCQIAKIWHLKVDHALVTSLVERWRPETLTFHFPTGECTITLQDISLQLGLNIDGPPIVGPTMFDWKEMCDTYLGVALVKGESLIGSQVKLKWLRENMLSLGEEPTKQQLHAHCRAYILGLIGGVLMPRTDNKVHLMYLTFLTNLCRTTQYNWGSACLAVLYRELCRSIDVKAKTMDGCASLLQSRAWYHTPYIAPLSSNLRTP